MGCCSCKSPNTFIYSFAHYSTFANNSYWDIDDDRAVPAERVPEDPNDMLLQPEDESSTVSEDDVHVMQKELYQSPILVMIE
jgi:hypothetical protein